MSRREDAVLSRALPAGLSAAALGPRPTSAAPLRLLDNLHRLTEVLDRRLGLSSHVGSARSSSAPAAARHFDRVAA